MPVHNLLLASSKKEKCSFIIRRNTNYLDLFLSILVLFIQPTSLWELFKNEHIKYIKQNPGNKVNASELGNVVSVVR